MGWMGVSILSILSMDSTPVYFNPKHLRRMSMWTVTLKCPLQLSTTMLSSIISSLDSTVLYFDLTT